MDFINDGWREELQELIDQCHIMAGGEEDYKRGVRDAIKVIEDHI